MLYTVLDEGCTRARRMFYLIPDSTAVDRRVRPSGERDRESVTARTPLGLRCVPPSRTGPALLVPALARAFQTLVTWSGFSLTSMHSISSLSLSRSRSFRLARFFFLWRFFEGGKNVKNTGRMTKQCSTVHPTVSREHLNSV